MVLNFKGSGSGSDSGSGRGGSGSVSGSGSGRRCRRRLDDGLNASRQLRAVLNESLLVWIAERDKKVFCYAFSDF